MNYSKPTWLYIDSVTLPLELVGKITTERNRITPYTLVHTECKTSTGKRLVDSWDITPERMRDATQEEQDYVQGYINGIGSKVDI
jgi:hypothetical protein